MGVFLPSRVTRLPARPSRPAGADGRLGWASVRYRTERPPPRKRELRSKSPLPMVPLRGVTRRAPLAIRARRPAWARGVRSRTWLEAIRAAVPAHGRCRPSGAAVDRRDETPDALLDPVRGLRPEADEQVPVATAQAALGSERRDEHACGHGSGGHGPGADRRIRDGHDEVTPGRRRGRAQAALTQLLDRLDERSLALGEAQAQAAQVPIDVTVLEHPGQGALLERRRRSTLGLQSLREARGKRPGRDHGRDPEARRTGRPRSRRPRPPRRSDPSIAAPAAACPAVAIRRPCRPRRSWLRDRPPTRAGPGAGRARGCRLRAPARPGSPARSPQTPAATRCAGRGRRPEPGSGGRRRSRVPRWHADRPDPRPRPRPRRAAGVRPGPRTPPRVPPRSRPRPLYSGSRACRRSVPRSARGARGRRPDVARSSSSCRKCVPPQARARPRATPTPRHR